MAARDHFGPQLQFFIPAGAFEEAAREIPDQVKFGDIMPYDADQADEQIDRLKRLKIAESRTERWGHPPLRPDIEESGRVKKPVALTSRFMREKDKDGSWGAFRNMFIVEDGHHRVFTAADIDPTMEIPVKYVQ